MFFFGICLSLYPALISAEEERLLHQKMMVADFRDDISGNNFILLWILLVIVSLAVLLDVAVVDWSVLFMQTTLGANEFVSTFSFATYYLVSIGAGVFVDYVSQHNLLTRRSLLILCACAGVTSNLMIAWVGQASKTPYSVPLAVLSFGLGGLGAPAVCAISFNSMSTLSGYSSVDTMSFLVLASNVGAAVSGILIGEVGERHGGNLTQAWNLCAALYVTTMLIGQLWGYFGGQNVFNWNEEEKVPLASTSSRRSEVL